MNSPLERNDRVWISYTDGHEASSFKLQTSRLYDSQCTEMRGDLNTRLRLMFWPMFWVIGESINMIDVAPPSFHREHPQQLHIDYKRTLDSTRGFVMSTSNWYGGLEYSMPGCDSRAQESSTLNEGQNCPSWSAMVVKIRFGLLQSAWAGVKPDGILWFD